MRPLLREVGVGPERGCRRSHPLDLANRTGYSPYVGITLANRKHINGREISEKDLPGIRRIDYWTDPYGRALTHCPFYRLADDGKVYCRIHDTKPRVCIGFTPWDEASATMPSTARRCRINAP